jgi:hypothetical protein
MKLFDFENAPGRLTVRGRLLKVTALVVVLAMCLTMLSACSSKPFDTVRKFADAYNELDYNKMIECYDPRITQAINGVANGIGGLFGLSGVDGDSAAAASSLVGDLLGEYAQQYWDERGISATMSVKELSTEMNGDDKARVTVQFTFKASNGEQQTWQETLSMVKIEGKWYITIGLSDIGSLFGS